MSGEEKAALRTRSAGFESAHQRRNCQGSDHKTQREAERNIRNWNTDDLLMPLGNRRFKDQLGADKGEDDRQSLAEVNQLPHEVADKEVELAQSHGGENCCCHNDIWIAS